MVVGVIKITKIEPNTIDPEALAFGPIECMNCNFDGSIPTEYFLVTPDPETDNDYIERNCSPLLSAARLIGVNEIATLH